MTRRPYWCSKQIVWELDSFLMEKIFFVPINFGLSIRAFREHEALVSSRVACKAKMHDYIMLMESLGFVCGLLLGNCGCQTDRTRTIYGPRRNCTPLTIPARSASRDKIINSLGSREAPDPMQF